MYWEAEKIPNSNVDPADGTETNEEMMKPGESRKYRTRDAILVARPIFRVQSVPRAGQNERGVWARQAAIANAQS